MKFLNNLIIGLLISSQVIAGLPPTTSKVSSDASNITTFNYQFPNFTGTHTGTTVSLGVNSAVGGGTGIGTYTTGDTLYSSSTNTLSKLSIGTTGQILTVASGLPSWATNPSAVITSWASYTPTILGFGTATSISGFWRQNGSNYDIIVYFTAGTVSGTTASVSLPNGSTIDSTVIPAIRVLGYGNRATTSTNGVSVLGNGGNSVLNLSQTGPTSGVNPLTAQPGNGVCGSGEVIHIVASVPISGLSGTTQPSILPVATRYTGSATAISGSLSTIVFATQDTTTSTQTMPSGIFTVATGGAGRYSIHSNEQVTGTIALNSTVDCQLVKNGSTVLTESQQYAGGAMTAQNCKLDDDQYLAVGDTLQIKLSSSATLPAITNSSKTWISIVKVSQ